MNRTPKSPPILPIFVSLMAIALWAFGPDIGSALRYERATVNASEFYRMFMAHFVHVDGSHLALNLVGLALVWWLVGQGPRLWEWVVIGLVAQLAVVIGLYAITPQVAWYVGMSGMLHGLLVGGAMLRAPQEAVVIAGLVFLKVTWELLAGPTSSNFINAKIIYEAHVFGALGGLAAGTVLRSLGSPPLLEQTTKGEECRSPRSSNVEPTERMQSDLEKAIS